MLPTLLNAARSPESPQPTPAALEAARLVVQPVLEALAGCLDWTPRTALLITVAVVGDRADLPDLLEAGETTPRPGALGSPCSTATNRTFMIPVPGASGSSPCGGIRSNTRRGWAIPPSIVRSPLISGRIR